MQKKSSVANIILGYLHNCFSKIVFVNENHCYDFLSINVTARSKKRKKKKKTEYSIDA